MPPEYCRYNTKLYAKCLEWMKQKQPDLFAEEIKDLSGTQTFLRLFVSSLGNGKSLHSTHILFARTMRSERDPKTAEKTRHLWDENFKAPEEEKKSDDNQSKGKKGKRKRQRKKKGNAPNDSDEETRNAMKQRTSDSDPELTATKKVKILEKAVNAQQQNANDQMSDIQSKLNALSMDNEDGDDWNAVPQPTRSSILKNRENPNFEAEKEALNSSQMNSDVDSELDSDAEEQKRIAEYMGGGNMNRGRGAPSRKELKQRKKQRKKAKADKKRGKKGRKSRGKGSDEEDEDEEGESEEEERVPVVKFKGKVPKGAVECELQNRKGNKKVTVIRGFLEKSPEKESRIKSEFMKKFATSVTITFQNQGADKGPRQVVLMGNKQYDFMKFLHEKFPKAGKLLYYKSKKYGMTPAVDPSLGIVLPPPGRN